jgi:hypothetical protein
MKGLVYFCRCLVSKYPKLQALVREEDWEELATTGYQGSYEDPQLSNALSSHVFWELRSLATLGDAQVKQLVQTIHPKRTEILKPPLNYFKVAQKTHRFTPPALKQHPNTN